LRDVRRLAWLVGCVALVLVAGAGGYWLGISSRPTYDQLHNCQNELVATRDALRDAETASGDTIVAFSGPSGCM
jgi:hypothetical protein